MNCMRCGKETEEKAVFCQECLEEMERYPVKPGTLIHLPVRSATDPRKTVKKRRELSVEEQLANTQHLLQIMFITALCLLGALIVTGILLVFSFSNNMEQSEDPQPPQGPNYTIIAPAEE